MRLGVMMMTSDLAMPVPELARAAEERGFVSLFVPEHTHMPVERSRRLPDSEEADELPEPYRRSLDPLVALAAALPALREACERAGRPMVDVLPVGTLPTREKLDHLAGLGVEEVVVGLPSGPGGGGAAGARRVRRRLPVSAAR
jgi:hypothetical protein